MSYEKYDGTITAKSGKSADSAKATADISDVIPTGLSSQELLNTMIDRYSIDTVSEMIWNSYKIVIQRAGQQALKNDPTDTQMASDDMVEKANSDLTAGRSKPRITKAKLISVLESQGISAKKIEQTLAELLAVTTE